MQNRLLPLLFVCASWSCVKDRTFPDRIPDPGELTIAPGVLKVNEFVAAGSQNMNEFGTTEDWFEVYNPNDVEVRLEAGKWFVSDAGPSTPTKYQLPELTIAAKGFLVIWCDNMNTVQTQVHTNFALSSAGEHIVLYYSDGVSAEFVVDDRNYGPQSVPGASEGRFPDGEDNWILFPTPTPGQSNN